MTSHVTLNQSFNPEFPNIILYKIKVWVGDGCGGID